MSIDSKVICNTCGWSGSEDKVSVISGISACPNCCECEDLDFCDSFEEEPTEEEPTEEELRESEKDNQNTSPSLENLNNGIEICDDYIENIGYDDEILCNTCGWLGSKEELDREGVSPACPNCYEDEDLETIEE